MKINLFIGARDSRVPGASTNKTENRGGKNIQKGREEEEEEADQNTCKDTQEVGGSIGGWQETINNNRGEAR